VRHTSTTSGSKDSPAKLLAFIDSGAPVDPNTWLEFDRLFETNSATLRPESRAQLSNITAILQAYPRVNVKIGGYTDNSGDPAANLQLSQARATTVRNELGGMGIESRRLEAEGFGDQHPVADNSTAEGRARNRRVALRVTTK
jgi:outer membrane protein OmpA-like peptidoglycan-associated protein